MSVRSAMPWPIRWILGAVMLGFSAAIGLWAFEFGKGIAGLDSNAKDELQVLRAEVALLKQEREKARTIANTSGSLLTAEKAAQEKTAAQLQQIEAINVQLRDDLGFFEKLLPAANADGIAAITALLKQSCIANFLMVIITFPCIYKLLPDFCHQWQTYVGWMKCAIPSPRINFYLFGSCKMSYTKPSGV